MITKALGIVSICTLMVLLVSCAEPATSPSLTSGHNPAITHFADGGRILWAYYDISIDRDTGTVEAVPVRDVAGHWNVLKWLEQGPCTNCLKVVGTQDLGTAYPKFDIQITHPFSSPNLTGFDVRGIAIFDGTVIYPESGLILSESTVGDFQLLSSDGLTALYSCWTEGKGPGGTQGYIKGKMSTPKAPKGTLNAFHTFVSSDPANTRNAFYAGDSITRTYWLYWPSSKPIRLGYAVDASWAPPTANPVTDPMKDFPPEANCSEPWQIAAWISKEGLTELGGYTELTIDVHDYQGKDSHEAPFIECPQLFDHKLTATWIADYSGYSEYKASIYSDGGIPHDLYYVLIGVEDKDNASSPAWLDLSAYRMLQVWVEEVGGWANTWGGPNGDDNPWAIAQDSEGNVYVAGGFYGEQFDYIDFDPGPDTNGMISNGKTDAFLSKFDQNGEYLWAVTWGGTEDDVAAGVAVDDSSVYVVGDYKETVDFDPGNGDASSTAVAGYDSFIVAFDPDGNYEWHSAWGGHSMDYARGVTAVTDNSQVYIVGDFLETVDFDPGPGTDEHAALLWTPASYLTCYSTSGTYNWTKSWGSDNAAALCVPKAVDWSTSNELYVAGYFRDTVDFDPSAGSTTGTSNGGNDAYFCGFGLDGELWWAKTWGGTYDDYAADIDASSGTPYVTGDFRDTVDLDPGPGVTLATSNGSDDIFVSQFQYNGDLYRTYAFGGSGTDSAYGVAASYSIEDVIYVTGYFTETVDFDPGPGIEYASSNGDADIFLLSLNKSDSDSLNWVRTFGGINNEYSYAITTDYLGDAIFCGAYWGTTDFDPVGNTGTHTSNGNYDIYVDKVLYTGSW